MRNLIKKFYYKIVDKYAFFGNVSKPMQFWVGLRHKLAGKGFPITSNERRFARLKDKHKGQRCFIIGNGPSLNKLDLTLLKDEFTFGVNAIYLNYEKMQFHPTYYVVEDVFVAEDRREEIDAYKGPRLKFYGNYLRGILAPDEKTLWVNVLRNYSDPANFPMFSENANRSLGVGGSVTYVCMQLAYHMGFKEVYMIGFDHSYKIPDSAIITNPRESGFDIMSTEDDPNHFHKDYFGKGFRWHDPKVDRMEIGFLKAKEHFERDGRIIYNATVEGKLEAFPRVDYKTLFKA